MADRIRVAIHHQEGVLPAGENEVGGIVVRPSGVAEKIRVTIFELESILPARDTRNFDFAFGKLHSIR